MVNKKQIAIFFLVIIGFFFSYKAYGYFFQNKNSLKITSVIEVNNTNNKQEFKTKTEGRGIIDNLKSTISQNKQVKVEDWKISLTIPNKDIDIFQKKQLLKGNNKMDDIYSINLKIKSADYDLFTGKGYYLQFEEKMLLGSSFQKSMEYYSNNKKYKPISIGCLEGYENIENFNLGIEVELDSGQKLNSCGNGKQNCLKKQSMYVLGLKNNKIIDLSTWYSSSEENSFKEYSNKVATILKSITCTN